MSHDPLAALYDALERADCSPHGPEDSFRARCPAHDGDNDSSLHVAAGPTGQALIFCYAHQCEAEAVVAALGLTLSHLFPNHGEQRPKNARRERAPADRDAAQEVLVGLSVVGIDWEPARHRDGTLNTEFFVADKCPACKSPSLWIHRYSQRQASVGCWGGCSQRSIRAALRLDALAR